LDIPKIDKLLGIDVYATETFGVGGVIRDCIDDFRVEEVLIDGSKAEIGKFEDKRVLRAVACKQPYLLCILLKRNWDTFIAIRNVARQLGLSQGHVQIAGIKDARAITAQYITIQNISMENISKASFSGIEIRPVGYVHEKLSPYYLLGNDFSIRVKSINRSKSTIEKRITAVSKELDAVGGIPNFFGHQRFGTTRPLTHLVGKAIVDGDFEAAAMLFLADPSVHEHPQSRKARKELQSTHDFRQALQDFPKQLRFERLMLSYLIDKPADFVGAFKRLPIKLQALFVQAYQSYLFNRFLSERIKKGFYLDKAEIGDYVVNVERSGLPMLNMAKVAVAETVKETNQLIKAGRMRVALPLIGIRQRLSQGVIGQIERHVLEEESVKTESFKVPSVPEMSMRGNLRAVISPIQNFKLNNVSICSHNQRERLVELSFMLLRGSYATVLLREIMKPSNPVKSGF
jgi:tRNA pseudouridine13 synthase